MAPRRYKLRNPDTSELIEFDFDGTPTPADIDRIVAEYKAKQKPPPRSTFEPARRDNVSLPDLDTNNEPNPASKPDYFNLPSMSSIAKWGTTSIMPDVEEDISKFSHKYGGDTLGDISDFVVGGATSPLGLATSVIGGGAWARAAKRAIPKSAGAKLADKAADMMPPVNTIDNALPNRLPPEFSVDMPPINKPRYRAVRDPLKGDSSMGNIMGYEPLPNLDEIAGIPTVQLADDAMASRNTALPTFAENMGGSIPPRQLPGAELPVNKPRVTRLSNDLVGAKPRFNIGYNSYEPAFESDIDKALYIIAQSKPSARNADYMKFLKGATGLDEAALVLEGKRVRSQIKNMVGGQPPGPVKIPSIFKMADEQNVRINPQTGEEFIGDSPVKTELAPSTRSRPTSGFSMDTRQSTLPPFISPTNAAKTPEIQAIWKRAVDAHINPRNYDVDDPLDLARLVADIDKKAPQIMSSDILPDMKNVTPIREASMNDFVPDESRGIINLDPKEKKSHLGSEIMGLPKSLWAAIDFSAPLRQGKGLIHKGGITDNKFAQSIIPMFKSTFSEDAYQASQAALKSDPNFLTQTKSGLAFTCLDDITNREEAIISSLAEKIPGIGKAIRGTNRGYTTFLNKLRSDTFDSMYDASKKADMNMSPDQISKFINEATGRGDLKLDLSKIGHGDYKLGKIDQEKNAVMWNNIFFSPRFISSRLKMLGQGGKAIVDLPKAALGFKNADAAIQKEYIKSLVATTAYWATGVGLAKSLGADVTMDPSSSDFGKIVVGNTRIDTTAGLQPFIRVTYQLLSGTKTAPMNNGRPGRTKNLGEGFKAETELDVAANFVRNKMAPIPGAIIDFARNRTPVGKPARKEMKRFGTDFSSFSKAGSSIHETSKNYFLEAITPNMITTMKDLYREDPSLFSGFAGVGALFGESVQVFDEYEPSASRSRTRRRTRAAY